ncbi:MAG: NAD(P)/FAD-dependent oxidoreductase [Candidatus Izimaplasma sp.]|nr:NAD(P)/FAD-dependent oxidoreductase [Candidatus Izimaplasma bacterium]
MREIVVIGGGASGLAVALETKKRGRDVLLIEREEDLGGILNQCIHNGFGLEVFEEEYTGPEYANKYIEEFLKLDIDYHLNTTVLKIEKTNNYFEITMSSKARGIEKIKAKAVVISTGSYERSRGSIIMPGERPYGVITAGSAQRYLNIDGYMVGKRVFILGSGDIGLIMARRMFLEGAKVLGVAEIMPYSNGLTRNIVQCLDDFDIPLYLSHTVTDVKSGESNRLESIVIQKVDENFNPIENTAKVFEVDTLLLSIGLIPDIALLDNLEVVVDSLTKSAKINQAYETSVRGLFICGNSLQVHDLVDNVTLESIRAGKCVSDYLEKKLEKNNESIDIIPGKNVGYVTPQVLDFSWSPKELIISFRGKKKMEKTKIKVFQNNELVFEKFKQFIVPAEMETIKLDYSKLNKFDELGISLEEL